MARNKKRTKKITINQESGAFSAIFSRLRGKETQEKEKNPEISLLRSILSQERARMLHILKEKKPNSLYELAKLLGRDFKSVRADILTLERAGLVETIPIHKGKREKLKPLLVVDALEVTINL